MATTLHWRNAKLPDATALFVVGDIHANHLLLAPLLGAMHKEISALPLGTAAIVVFIGDYIDRGPSAPLTIELLLDFERSITARAHTSVTFLCGNHDEYFARFLDHRGIVDAVIEGHPKPRDLIYTTSAADGTSYLTGLESWLFFGGGITTLRDYDPTIDLTLFDKVNRCFNREHPTFSIANIEALLQRVIANVPASHRDFFRRCYANCYAIIGDYLMTHAGINPMPTLPELGVGERATPLSGKALIDFLMIRNPFLWRESLPHCPYVVVHGHTPSDIIGGGSVMVDGQKDYRLCVDTAAYLSYGAITCFVRYESDAYFMAANAVAPDSVIAYNIPPIGQKTAQKFHQHYFPQYHQKPIDWKLLGFNKPQ